MSKTPEQPVIPKIKYSAILSVISRGFHIDKRSLTSYRSIEITYGISPKAEGSALVKLGNTQVLVGVKLEVGQPYPDTPNEGAIIVNAEYIPAASPSFEPGPPDENAIELARIIDRSLRESRAVALDKLCIIPGKKVWIIWLDIYILDYDGNLVDASMLASMAALLNTYIPYYEVDEVQGLVKIDKSKKHSSMPINKHVVTVTISKIGEALVVDPTAEEESLTTYRLAIAIDEEKNIVGLQKMGLGALSEKELDEAISIALTKSDELFSILKKSRDVKLTL
ncbi:MAG: exosome complex protein Rrp42 [Ignisphaera sp.]|uniref:Exosome complex component Rrp42 n=1 Tax=Ignisphaera aggregans TaxID=334771 RepID=A0A7J3MZD0_9CREN